MRIFIALSLLTTLMLASHTEVQAKPVAFKQGKAELAKLYKISDNKKLQKAVDKLSGREIATEDVQKLFDEATTLQTTPPKKLPELKDIHEGALEYVYEVRSKTANHKTYAMIDKPRSVKASTPAPLLLALHSTHGTAWRELAGIRACARQQPKLAECLVVAPNALNRGLTATDPTQNPKKGDLQYFLWGPQRQGIDSILLLIRSILRDFNIDRNRIYLTGMGDGATAAFHLAQLMPSLFAGVCIRDGLPPHYYTDKDYIKDADARKKAKRAGELDDAEVEFPWVKCYRNTPIHWVHGDDDKKMLTAHARKCIKTMTDAGMPVTDYEYKGFHGGGETALVAKALTATIAETRNNYPSTITARGIKSEKWTRGSSRNYWLKIVKEKYLKKGGGWEYKPLAGAEVVTVTIDRAENTIEVTGGKGMKLELYLNHNMLYIDREITLIVNGKEKKLTAKHDLGVLCDTTNRFRWTSEIYTAKVEVTIP